MSKQTKKGARPRTLDSVARERRQRETFRLYYIERKTYDEIRQLTGNSTATICSDLKAERVRRAADLAAERTEEIAVQLAMVEEILAKAMEDRLAPGSGAYAAATKALELRARLLGLEAPQRVDISVGRRVTFEVIDVQVTPIEDEATAISGKTIEESNEDANRSE